MDERVPCSECGKPVSAVLARQRGGLCFTCRRKHEETVLCTECGKPVLAKLASKRNGLCLRCSANRNPFFALFNNLIGRVYDSGSGFESLSDAEKQYYALTLFQGEVNNGGFHQFFFNNSGAYYELVENALVAFDEPRTLQLLHQAKQVVFPEIAVPTDTETRRSLMPPPDPDVMNRLNELDQQFYRTPDSLSAKLQAFARAKGLIPTERDDETVSS